MWIYYIINAGLMFCQCGYIIPSTVDCHCALCVLSQHTPPRAVMAFPAIPRLFVGESGPHNISAGLISVCLGWLMFCLLYSDFVYPVNPLHLCCCVLCRFSWSLLSLFTFYHPFGFFEFHFSSQFLPCVFRASVGYVRFLPFILPLHEHTSVFCRFIYEIVHIRLLFVVGFSFEVQQRQLFYVVIVLHLVFYKL